MNKNVKATVFVASILAGVGVATQVLPGKNKEFFLANDPGCENVVISCEAFFKAEQKYGTITTRAKKCMKNNGKSYFMKLPPSLTDEKGLATFSPLGWWSSCKHYSCRSVPDAGHPLCTEFNDPFEVSDSHWCKMASPDGGECSKADGGLPVPCTAYNATELSGGGCASVPCFEMGGKSLAPEVCR